MDSHQRSGQCHRAGGWEVRDILLPVQELLKYTQLLPWALTKLLQGDLFTAAGLLCIYIAAVVTRTVLEPRFYGKHLGLDPLVMLVFLYFGYRLWGFLGIVISPLLAATTKALTEK